MQPLLTIAIPYYSNIELLARAIKSAVNQTCTNIEILICDDLGPGPRAEETVCSFGDPRLRYSRNPKNLGIAGNWNRCLELASSDLVTLLHADDELESGYADLMVAQAQRSPEAAAIFCQAQIINSKSEQTFSFPDYVKTYITPSTTKPFTLKGADALAQILKGQFIFCPTLCYRKSRLGERRFSEKWRQVLDLDFISRLLLDGESIVGLPEHAYRYRRHSDNQTAKQTADLSRFKEELEIYDVIAAESQRRGWQKPTKIGKKKRIIKLNLAYTTLKNLLQFKAAATRVSLQLLLRTLFSPSQLQKGRP